jgi:hypothetical protein
MAENNSQMCEEGHGETPRWCECRHREEMKKRFFIALTLETQRMWEGNLPQMVYPYWMFSSWTNLKKHFFGQYKLQRKPWNIENDLDPETIIQMTVLNRHSRALEFQLRQPNVNRAADLEFVLTHTDLIWDWLFNDAPVTDGRFRTFIPEMHDMKRRWDEFSRLY